jgi:hypothetical protein
MRLIDSEIGYPSGLSLVSADDLQLTRAVGDITLMAGWTSLNPDRYFARQLFEIRAEIKTARLERDGRLSVTSRPMSITWYGHRACDLHGIMQIKIVSSGHVLVNGALSLQQKQPVEVAGGVRFDMAADN